MLQQSSSVGRSITRSLSSKSLSSRSLTRSLSTKSIDKSMNSPTKAEREPCLLEQLGGLIVLKAVMQEFGRRLTRDPELQPFFQEVNPHVLVTHQERFFALAFTEVNIPQASLVIRRAHRNLFAKGLCEDHFDIFVQHFAETLTDRGFDAAIVGQALDALEPLRDIIQDAAEDYQEEQQEGSQRSPKRSAVTAA